MPVRTGRFQWLMRDWVANDASAFAADWDQLLATIDAPNTLLQLKLAGITTLGDRIAMLDWLDLRADDLVGRPSEEDLASLAVEGMLGTAAAKLGTRIEEGGPEGVIARRALERLFVEYSRETA